MKKLTKFRFGHVAMFIMAATLSFTACTKDEIEDDSTKDGEEAIPEFVSYTPEYAEIGVETDAMIMGKNFGTDASRITVMLGEKEMTVTEAGRSVIKFTVPETMEAGQYPLSVTVVYTDSEGVEQKASHTFEVDFEIRARVPEITGYKPAAGIYPGGELTIEGTDLGSDPALVTVTLGGEALEVKSVAPGAIVVLVPEETAFGTYELKVDVKYGTSGSQTATKTFSDFNVLKKEYVVTSEVWSGGAKGIVNGPRSTASYQAPYSLAYDSRTKSLYVGESTNGIRLISNDNVSWYRSPNEGNPWAFPESCSVCIQGDNLYNTVKEGKDRTCNLLWMASREGNDYFGKEAGYQDKVNDFMDVAVNPVDGHIVLTKYTWDAFRMESYFYILDRVDGTMTQLDEIPALWAHNQARLLFSPDGKWLYVARGCDMSSTGGGGAEQPHAFIIRYPYDPVTHSLASEGELVAGSKATNEIGFEDGAVGTSRLNGPRQMCFNSTGEILYFVDQHNHALRKVTYENGTWTTTTVAGTGQAGCADITDAAVTDMSQIQLDNPKGLALGDDYTFYIGEDGSDDHKQIRKISLTLKAAE